MRYSKGQTKQSGDVHPPELDDGMDYFETRVDDATGPAYELMPTRSFATPIRKAPKPSWKPLLGLLAGGFFLYRLMR